MDAKLISCCCCGSTTITTTAATRTTTSITSSSVCVTGIEGIGQGTRENREIAGFELASYADVHADEQDEQLDKAA